MCWLFPEDNVTRLADLVKSKEPGLTYASLSMGQQRLLDEHVLPHLQPGTHRNHVIREFAREFIIKRELVERLTSLAAWAAKYQARTLETETCWGKASGLIEKIDQNIKLLKANQEKHLTNVEKTADIGEKIIGLFDSPLDCSGKCNVCCHLHQTWKAPVGRVPGSSAGPLWLYCTFCEEKVEDTEAHIMSHIPWSEGYNIPVVPLGRRVERGGTGEDRLSIIKTLRYLSRNW